MKKLKYGIVFCLFLLGIDIYFVDAIKDISEKQNIAETEVFETFEKQSERIVKRKSSVGEILRLQTLQHRSRQIANVKDQSNKKIVLKKRGERILIGQNNKRLQDENKPIKILNKYNKEWKNLLSEQILGFLPVGSKTIIKRKDGFVKVINDRGVLLEKAVVSIQLPKGARSSYHALVDSSNGRILHTWNASRAEVDGFPLILKPSGQLYSPKMPRN